MLSHTVSGGKIREVRELRGMSVAQLAEAAGITAGFLYKIENGNKEPGRQTAGAIARALGLRFEDILGARKPQQTRRRRRGAGHDTSIPLGKTA